MALPDRSTIQGEYFFNETSGTNVPDTSGNSYDLTTTNSPTWESGLVDNCLDFSAASSYARAADAAKFVFDHSQKWSVNYWHYNGSNAIRRVVTKFGSKGYLLGYVNLYPYRPHIHLYVSAGAQLQCYSTTLTAPNSQWNNVGMSFDGNNNVAGVTLVVNGADASITSLNDTLSTNSFADAGATFQVSGYSGGQYWENPVDILRISTVGTEWSLAEHQSFYNSGAGVEEYPTGASDDHIKRYYYR